jgi:hypothetical protein
MSFFPALVAFFIITAMCLFPQADKLTKKAIIALAVSTPPIQSEFGIGSY